MWVLYFALFQTDIVSGPLGRESVHYDAIKPEFIESEMNDFLYWFNNDHTLDYVLKAAIAHF